MKRVITAVLAMMLSVWMLAGCGEQPKTYVDGVYRAEFTDYYMEYRSYVVATVQDGEVTEIVFDGVNADGQLRSEDEKYREKMEATQGTYPQKYSQDLVVQYLEQQDISQVDVIANATDSSNQFIQLFTALEPQMESGDTTTIYI